MPVFASTTIAPTSTYSDPLRAQSIKALEQRYKEMAAQGSGAITPENTATPIQGFGHLANQLGDSFQRSRVDQAIAAQKQQLAQVMAGMDPNNPKPHEIAAINTADPEMAKQMLMQLAEYRRAQMQDATTRRSQDMTAASSREGHDVTRSGNEAQVAATLSGQSNQAAMETARLDAAKAAAAELARTQEAQKVADEKRLQERPTDEPLVTLRRALERHEISQQEYDARAKQLTMPKVNEQEFILKTQKESIDNQSALGTLDQALGYIDHPDSIFAGRGAGMKTKAADLLPEKLTGFNEKTRENTQSFNKIMGGQALQQLTQMKGASSDKDVAVNFAIANDPDATPEEKKRAILVLKDKLNYCVKLNNAAIEGAGGTAPVLPKGGSTDPAVKSATDPARAAATDPAAADKVVDVVSEAQAKQLPPNTRFRLPDGRTGRTK